MKNSLKCAHRACECRARRSSRYCSRECEVGDTAAASDCACGHKACAGEDADQRPEEPDPSAKTT